MAKTLYKRFHSNHFNHRNPLISNLSSLSIPSDPGRRLKRKWCRNHSIMYFDSSSLTGNR
ncbi:Uncharacterized protein FWK35_00003171 [Aphis craccivora]|uniref:Uncharacterized protein n=1 Tax=Aphis craccivora TaxID=307492 RepID=A0A6G0ZMB8_APHCR|nr:Uncharacterized protein FWK35_00003171 [Aphis craccivora]